MTWAVLLLAAGGVLRGQITTVGNDTATPIAGAGHDYRQMLSEIVSPANGSLSVRIATPMPKARGLTIPFSFNYDSAGQYHVYMAVGQGSWEYGTGFLNIGGWTYGIPLLTGVTFQNQYGTTKTGAPLYCIGQKDFVFTDSAGERDALTSLTFLDPTTACASSSYFQDDRYMSQITNAASGTIQVAGHDGTVYTFNLPSEPGSTNQKTALPVSVKDRNGNEATVVDSGAGAFTVTDSSGRAAITSTGFGTAGSTYELTVSGLSAYKVAWGSAAANYTVGYTQVSGNDCRGINSNTATQAEITSITLPNAQQYQFQYDPKYGLLSKVIYPNGAYSRYVWGFNARSEQVYWQQQGANETLSCYYEYDVPAVQSRFVSFDGTNEVLEEDYSYGTTWTGSSQNGWSGKSTTVTTTVRAVSKGLQTVGSFSTVYNYTPYKINQNPYDVTEDSAAVALQIPLEQSIAYGDFNGKTLKTVTKTWQDQFLMASQTVELNDNSTSEVVYGYNSNSELQTELEYDYGAGAVGGLLRKTAVNYQAFAVAPNFVSRSAILDRPCQVITYDNTGTNRVAETDYYYDGGTSVCGTAGTPSVTAVSGLTGHDEVYYGSGSTAARGNLTEEARQDIQLGTAATSKYAFDETGQVVSATDALGNVTGYSYADSFVSGFGNPTPGETTNTYLTTLTLPSTGTTGPLVSHLEAFAYRYADGQLASASDQNSPANYTYYSYGDPLGRLTETDYPDGGKTTVAYNDTASPPTIVTNKLLAGTTYLTTTAVLDGAGHAVQSQLNSDPAGTDLTDKIYDGLGRVYSVSNPYRSTGDITYGVTSYLSDALGRTTKVTTPDGAVAGTAYTGPSATVTDQALHVRTTTADALGRITKVVEDPGSPVCSASVPQPCHFNYITTYGYDALDDLTGVNQSGQMRTFTYDSLKRLTKAVNPESGTINYAYDLNGNLKTKADGRPKTVSYGYDQLNRVTGKTYSDGTPAVTYAFDAGGLNSLGHLTSVTNGNSTTGYGPFDANGRPRNSVQTTAGQAYTFGYAYNLAGSLTTETYPSGRVVTTTYDGANRASGVSGVLGTATTNYASSVGYTAFGSEWSYVYGNNVARLNGYNTRLQMNGYGDTNNTTGVKLVNASLVWGATNNNGNLQTATYTNLGTGTAVTPFTDTYLYDTVNRLTSATDTGGWWRGFAYDAFGNMTPSGNPAPPTVSFNGNNQIATQTYDAAGNQLTVLGNTQTYDAENRQVSVTFAGASETYLYDGDGKRVEKTGPSGTTVFVYDAQERLIAEYGTAVNTSPCTTCYLSGDHLGSTRLVTDQGGNVMGRHDYLPFGEEVAAGTFGRNGQWGAGNDFVNQKFTGKERDSESGLDYFGARYYGSALGRWTSPDWSARPQPVPYMDVSNPQTLNLYSYSGNNPLGRSDPDGHCDIDVGDGKTEHHWGWCIWHTLGFYETKPEEQARIANERRVDRDWGAFQQDPRTQAMVAISTIYYGGVVGAEEGGAGAAAEGGGDTIVVERVMSEAELEATESTGLLRGGREGTHYVTDAAPDTASEAQQQLALPRTPEVKVRMEVPRSAVSQASTVNPAFGQPGGGSERTATGSVPVRILSVTRLQ